MRNLNVTDNKIINTNKGNLKNQIPTERKIILLFYLTHPLNPLSIKKRVGSYTVQLNESNYTVTR